MVHAHKLVFKPLTVRKIFHQPLSKSLHLKVLVLLVKTGSNHKLIGNAVRIFFKGLLKSRLSFAPFSCIPGIHSQTFIGIIVLRIFFDSKPVVLKGIIPPFLLVIKTGKVRITQEILRLKSNRLIPRCFRPGIISQHPAPGSVIKPVIGVLRIQLNGSLYVFNGLFVLGIFRFVLSQIGIYLRIKGIYIVEFCKSVLRILVILHVIAHLSVTKEGFFVCAIPCQSFFIVIPCIAPVFLKGLLICQLNIRFRVIRLKGKNLLYKLCLVSLVTLLLCNHKIQVKHIDIGRFLLKKQGSRLTRLLNFPRRKKQASLQAQKFRVIL